VEPAAAQPLLHIRPQLADPRPQLVAPIDVPRAGDVAEGRATLLGHRLQFRILALRNNVGVCPLKDRGAPTPFRNSESMNPANTAAIAQSRVLTVTAPAAGADPVRFLRRATGPRGFWARSDRWIAHAGVLATVSAEGTPPGRLFSGIETSALDLFVPGAAQGVGDAPGVRLFGGFAFRPEYATVDLWSCFPPALFHVPQLELESVSGGPPRLTVRILVDPKRERDESILTRLLAHAGRLCRELNEATEDGPRGSGGSPVLSSPRVPFTQAESERADWDAAVRGALAEIGEGRMSKVVLARTLDVVTAEPLDPIEVVRRLWKDSDGSHVFFFEPEPGRALVGAAPETVTTVSQGHFRATAVAGTVARGETPEEQDRLAKQLLESEKEGVEQRIALDDMVARLGPLAEEVRSQPEPHVLTLALLQHLETEIHARLTVGTSALTVLEALHPTPAVCGLPRDTALEFIGEQEPFDRGWYAGPVGWFDLDGNGEFVPALRCAVVHDDRWRLFAGAGIVRGSDPGLEWEETSIKFEPMLRALAASGAR
jgi:menaquinone-specific isochorismate synthase